MYLGKAAFLRPFGLYKQLTASITHLYFQPLRITPLDLLLMETAKIYFHTIAVTFAFLSILYRAHFFFAMVQYLYFVISKRRVRLDFLRNRRQLLLRNATGSANIAKSLTKQIHTFLLPRSRYRTGPTEGQKRSRMTMKKKSYADKTEYGYPIILSHATFGRLRLSAAPQHSYDL